MQEMRFENKKILKKEFYKTLSPLVRNAVEIFRAKPYLYEFALEVYRSSLWPMNKRTVAGDEGAYFKTDVSEISSQPSSGLLPRKYETSLGMVYREPRMLSVADVSAMGIKGAITPEIGPGRSYLFLFPQRPEHDAAFKSPRSNSESSFAAEFGYMGESIKKFYALLEELSQAIGFNVGGNSIGEEYRKIISFDHLLQALSIHPYSKNEYDIDELIEQNIALSQKENSLRSSIQEQRTMIAGHKQNQAVMVSESNALKQRIVSFKDKIQFFTKDNKLVNDQTAILAKEIEAPYQKRKEQIQERIKGLEESTKNVMTQGAM